MWLDYVIDVNVGVDNINVLYSSGQKYLCSLTDDEIDLMLNLLTPDYGQVRMARSDTQMHAATFNDEVLCFNVYASTGAHAVLDRMYCELWRKI